MDRLSQERRSWNMSRIRSKNTKPEKYVRSILFSAGYRYNIHVKELPGNPDIVFKRKNVAIFIHGCFWHLHGCKNSTIPKTRNEWWKKKLESNKIRDDTNIQLLVAQGWRLIIIWECFIQEDMKSNTSESKILLQFNEFIKSDERIIKME